MPVKKDALGQRRVELEWLVPGTPEQVWAALATGPGISAWFVPAQVEPQVGGKIQFEFGEGASSSGTVTGWEPPRRFAYEERGWSEGAPPVATEIAITARSGSTCLVRMVHSLFAASDDWDDQLEGFEAGWPGFLEVLRLYLLHFAGQPAAPAGLSSVCAAGEAEAWRRLNRGLGLAGADVGTPVLASAGAPPLSGVVARIQQTHQRRELHLLLEQPGPGVAVVASYVRAGQAHGAVEAYFYGEHAEALAERHRELMRPWLARTLG
jgi:uncharacterized protein YndB with AHSA1/START domain